ncbi:M24 family metallopeptidase [Natronobacterium gregoryi]|uniref:Aminopeptidase P family protein n=2 Tax=Natronobacterium gregoryi TaxID=44930 RepID=L0AGD6_NATGS|nr:M24 family metallopeptidase [Natronobacterium gregoryi]AFZ72484.1 Xaa-Pro aminopeptidase [Natronobacterium gregoryi SP2]ELY74356.1 peptidase M24 [Natronobacterium gregoryi SP2]PLK21455.1 aminopeptidase P family protein [Natronobacterium gregoryi SP2]SFI77418.1 Xaa-Pro aminopeptidase [Natronobacterium gregoryi]
MAFYERSFMEGTRGTQAVDWEGRIDTRRLRERRRERALERLQETELGAMLLVSDPNIRYVTGLAMTGGSGADHYTLLTEEGDIVHWDTADHASNQRFNCPWLHDIRYACPGLGNVPRASGRDSARQFLLETMAEGVAEAATEYGVADEKLGVDVGNRGLLEALGGQGLETDVETANAVMEDARKVKTEDEIECLRMVAAICEAGFQRIKDAAKPGRRENELWGEAVRELWRHGAFVGGGYLTSGPNTWPKHQANTTDRTIRPGDLVYADFYNVGYLGYRSCYYRTFSMGEPTQEQKEAYEAARDNLYDVLERIEPGATTDEIARGFPDMAGEHADYYDADEHWQLTTNHWAHGLGLQLYEVPLIWRGLSPDHPIEIEEGMTMAVETQEPAGRQGVRVEEMVVVRENGVEILSQWPVEEITVVDQ